MTARDQQPDRRRSLATLRFALVALLAGCATPQYKPLAPSKVYTLAKSAERSSRLGVLVDRADDGTASITKINQSTHAKRTTLPLLLTKRGVPLVDIQLHGKRFRAVFDTGSSRTLTDFRTARSAGATAIADRTLYTFAAETPGGIAEAFGTIVRHSKLGSLQIYNFFLGVLNDDRPLHDFNWPHGAKTDVILGNDFASSFYRVTLDFNKERISLFSAGRHRPDEDQLVAAIPFVKKRGLILIRAHINNAGPVPVALSTGSHFGLWIPQSVANALRMETSWASAKTKTVHGSQGALAYAEIPSPHLDLDGYMAEDITTYVSTTDLGDKTFPYAIAGREVLGNHKVTIDYESRKIYLEKP